VAIKNGLILEYEDYYQFLPKLQEEHDFDNIRLENLIAVYDNEAEPITAVRKTMIKAMAEYDHVDPQKLAAWHFDDERRDLSWERHLYSKAHFDDINEQETATADPMPFFLRPEHGNGIGVLLIHGLLASPAETRSYGEYLAKQGYTVMGVRLKGHGSSPYALRDQSWRDWYSSVQRGFNILKAHCKRIFVTGFSTGAAMALKLASENHAEIIGITAIAVPLKFINSTFMLVPLLHGTNKLVGWVSAYEGVKRFIENVPENPTINYRHTPIRSLYELRLLIEDMDEVLPLINTPVLVIYADQDPIVSVKSAQELFEKLGAPRKQLKIINADRHGILLHNLGNTWEMIDDFMAGRIDETNKDESGQRRINKFNLYPLPESSR